MPLDLTQLQSELERNTSVKNSAKALITDLLARIEAAKADPAAIQAIVDGFRANDDDLAAAVETGTPSGRRA